ncbi:unnamed protein product [Cuscuta epithymum]|uniref:Uncharacterized protein n=1 Tax=Cuscuta epithymum TaxID=186058 RepID=A0AAV0EFC5_9ASTE|nr:unnamed protein product [Cuscuta epithymum]
MISAEIFFRKISDFFRLKNGSNGNERDQVGAHSHAAYDNDEVDLDNILSLHNEMEGDDDDMDNTEHAFKLCDVLFQPNDEDEIVGGQSNNMKNTFVFCY